MCPDLRLTLPVTIALFLSACGGGGGGGSTTPVTPNPDPTPDPDPTANCTTPIASGGAFSQTTASLGLCYEVAETSNAQDIQIQGGGLAMSDINKDGFLDLYVTHGIYEKGRLFLGSGTGFTPAQNNNGIEISGLDNAGYFIDIDSDGWDDFISIQYVTNYVEIFRNDGTGSFTEATPASGIFVRKPTYSLAAADYDLDGDVDLFFAHWGFSWRTLSEPITEYLWQNDGTGFFTDVSDIVEVKPSYRPPPIDDLLIEHSFTPIFADINSDRYPDMLLAGDFTSSQVLINNAGNSFSDATTAEISDENGMGAAVADYDKDGDLDWFVSSIYFRGRPEDKQYLGGITGNRLYENDGTGVFTDVTKTAGVRDGAWGWGACFEDFDNDGNVDIFHTNGMRAFSSNEGDETDPFFDYLADKSRLFMSEGDGTFLERSELHGVNHDDQGRGVICTDMDNDGWIDILVATNGKSPTVYKNQFNNSNHYLQIDLDGPPGNLKGIGARVTVETASGTQMREVVLGSNYLSQQPTTLHFGLGSDAVVIAVTVMWPGLASTETRIENVAVDQRLTIAAP
jgi:hypothetical protein